MSALPKAGDRRPGSVVGWVEVLSVAYRKGTLTETVVFYRGFDGACSGVDDLWHFDRNYPDDPETLAQRMPPPSSWMAL